LVELRGGGGGGPVMDLLVFTFMERTTSTWHIVLGSRYSDLHNKNYNSVSL
jgi:hypothetical protein